MLDCISGCEAQESLSRLERFYREIQELRRETANLRRGSAEVRRENGELRQQAEYWKARCTLGS